MCSLSSLTRDQTHIPCTEWRTLNHWTTRKVPNLAFIIALGVTTMEYSGAICSLSSLLPCVCAQLLQSCLTLCDSLGWSLPVSSVHGTLQTRILEWVAMPSSRGSSPPRDQTCVSSVSCVGRWILYHYTSASWEALYCLRWGGNLDTHCLAQCLANETCLH